jgi:hypothetical protein
VSGKQFPEPGSVAWYHERLVEEREANAHLEAIVKERDEQIATIRGLICEPCPFPHGGDDDT